MTFTNAISLAAAVTYAADLSTGLTTCERRERPLTDHVQRSNHGYGWLVCMWPEQMAETRSRVLQFLTGIPWVDTQFNRAARHLSAGDLG